MQIKKQNFIEQMTSELNAFHLEKVKLIELQPEYQQLFKDENKAKDALMEVEEDLTQQASFVSNSIEDIKGWTSNRAGIEGRIGSQKFNFKKNAFRANPSKNIQSANIYTQRNLNTIPYLKNVLEKLQSPKARKEVKTQKKCRTVERKKEQPKEEEKARNPETMFQMKRSKLQLRTIDNHKIHDRKPERAKFQALDLNGGENRPCTMQVGKANDYQKIKRKNPSQYEIDIAHQKQILQQLIRGTSRDQNGKYFSQRSSLQKVTNKQGNYEKFTLKNLLY